jgi:hypothetical protein
MMRHILKEAIMVFLAHVSIHHFKEMIQTLAEGSLDSEDPCGYVIELVGVVDRFDRVCVRIFIFIGVHTIHVQTASILLNFEGTDQRSYS